MPKLNQRETELLSEIARLRRNQEREETKESEAGTAGGATTFTGLNDTPGAYTGSAGAFLRVGAGTASVIFGTVDYTDLYNVPSTFAPTTHGSTHWAAGTDPVGTATPTANAIPYADGSGLLDSWISLAGTATLGRAAFAAADFSVSGGTASIGTAVPRFDDLADVATSGAYSDLSGIPSTFAPSTHASSHQDGGGDEIATATPGANAIIKADADGKIGAGWIDDADINLDNVTEGTTNKFFTATDETKLGTIEDNADVTDAGNVGSSIHGATAKTTPVDADTMPLIDSADSNVLKKVTWANIKATIATYYNSLAATLTNKTLDSTNISTLTAKNPPIDADSAVIVDSAASNVFKRVTYTNIKAFLKTYFDTLYAATANGVTNGDSHDHSGGDGAQIDHGGTGGLTDDDHTQYALLAGRSGGQTAYGGNAANDDLTLEPTSHATKTSAHVLLAPSGGNVGVGTSAPGDIFEVSLASSTVGGRVIARNPTEVVGASCTYYMLTGSGAIAGNNAMAFYRAIITQATPGSLKSKLQFFTNTGDSPQIAAEMGDDLSLYVAGNVGVGSSVTSPQGPLHAHDGTGGFLFVTKTSITGTAQTIIPDGTGDVVYQVLVEAVWRDSAGNAGSRTVTLAPSGTNYIVDDGGSNVLTLAVAANGSVTVQRTAGSRTYHVALRLLWL